MDYLPLGLKKGLYSPEADRTQVNKTDSSGADDTSGADNRNSGLDINNEFSEEDLLFIAYVYEKCYGEARNLYKNEMEGPVFVGMGLNLVSPQENPGFFGGQEPWDAVIFFIL